MSGKFSRAASYVRMERLRELLKVCPRSRSELIKKLECTPYTVDRYLGHMRKPEQKEIYIESWERCLEGGPPTAFYAYGDKEDAPKPRRFSEKQINRRYYQKMKREEPAKYAAYLERAKHKAKMRRRLKKGQPLVPVDPMLAWIPRRDMQQAA